MEKVTLDTAKKVIGGVACSFSYDLVNDVCVQTASCSEIGKYGTSVTNITKSEVAPKFCGVGVEPAV